MIRWMLWVNHEGKFYLDLADVYVRPSQIKAEFTATEAEAKSVLNWFIEGK